MIRDPEETRPVDLCPFRHFSSSFLRLSAAGRFLDPARSLEEEGLRDGDVVTAVLQLPQTPGPRVNGVDGSG